MTTTMDIAVCLDCSLSITFYLNQIRLNILSVLYKALMRHQNDIRIALIEFQSHTDFWVTNTHSFTSSIDIFEEWITIIRTDGRNSNECKAIGKRKTGHMLQSKPKYFSQCTRYIFNTRLAF